MNSKERIIRCLEKSGTDRPPVVYRAVPEITRQLAERLGCAPDEVAGCLGLDMHSIAPTWCGPVLPRFPDGSREGWWGERYCAAHQGSGIFQEMVHQPFAGITDPAELARHRQPSPDWFDYSGIKESCRKHGDKALFTGDPGVLDFINGIGRCRGQEQVLLDIASDDPVYRELVEQRFRFFFEVTERTLQAGDGLIDVVWCGEDLGSQGGPLISPRAFDRLFADRYRRFFSMVHSYGARTMMHSCGGIRPLITRLSELGLDILDVVQVSAAGMDIAGLQRDFGNRLTFSGSICVQKDLVELDPEGIRDLVRQRRALFPAGGLIIGPTNTIELGTPLDNIIAMYEACGSLAGACAPAI